MTGTTIRVAIGPDGSLLRLEDLPPSDLRRWVVRRKAEVVTAVQAGLLSLEAACARYNISVEEFEIWQSAIRRHGMGGLRVTRIQAIRRHDQDTQAGAPASGGSLPDQPRPAAG